MLNVKDKHDNYERRFLLWFAAFIVCTVMIFCFCVTFYPVPDKNKDLANFALGALIGSGFTAVVGFFYGSSKSNKEKDDTIASMAGAPKEVPLPLPVVVEEPKPEEGADSDGTKR